jgi:hypothetical protein
MTQLQHVFTWGGSWPVCSANANVHIGNQTLVAASAKWSCKCTKCVSMWAVFLFKSVENSWKLIRLLLQLTVTYTCEEFAIQITLGTWSITTTVCFLPILWCSQSPAIIQKKTRGYRYFTQPFMHMFYWSLRDKIVVSGGDYWKVSNENPCMICHGY